MAQKLLIVDDEAMNVDILQEYLVDAGYEALTASNGQEAWETLEDTPDIAVILLDRMMPVMDGMEFMRKMNAAPKFQNIPVIMQTAASSSEEILEGLRAGVFYYLTKPFERDAIINIVKAALENTRTQHKERMQVSSSAEPGSDLVTECKLTFRTMEEAEQACIYASRLFPDPSRVLIGLCELAYNAVEHGNLGISCEEKNQFILEGRLRPEIEKRLNNPQYVNRVATLHVKRYPEGTEALIADKGAGFNHSAYKNIDPLKVTKLNGRGVAIARMMSFDRMEYNKTGNQVTCWCSATPEITLTRQNQAPAA